MDCVHVLSVNRQTWRLASQLLSLGLFWCLLCRKIDRPVRQRPYFSPMIHTDFVWLLMRAAGGPQTLVPRPLPKFFALSVELSHSLFFLSIFTFTHINTQTKPSLLHMILLYLCTQPFFYFTLLKYCVNLIYQNSNFYVAVSMIWINIRQLQREILTLSSLHTFALSLAVFTCNAETKEQSQTVSVTSFSYK